MRFAVDTKLFYGKNATEECINESFTESAELYDIVLIYDKNVNAKHVLDAYRDRFNTGEVEVSLTGEPTYDEVDAIRDDVYTADYVVAIGGGSVMDIGKAVGVAIENPGPSVEMRGMNKVRCPGAPVICYPTTAGTGAEVTHTASLIDSSTGKKMGINGRYVAPMAAVFAPELLFDSPQSVTVGSGLDAMVHAYEATTSRMSTMTTELLGTAAFDIMTHALPSALICPKDYRIREMGLLGAYYAGIAMMNSAGGLASACSYPLGTKYKIPHGFAGGVLLPHEMALYGLKGYRDGFHHKFHVYPFMGSIKAPKNFGDWGFKKDDVQEMTDIIMEERGDVLKLAPVNITREDVEKLLESVAV